MSTHIAGAFMRGSRTSISPYGWFKGISPQLDWRINH